ncbi:MAG: hypothetical protein JNM43_22875 [Planctomycetaceae bacterium]|nr:hypothetical protein [Planctomycetaceae bacterium]
MGTTTFVWDPVSDCVLMELDETDNVKAVYTNEARQYGGVLSQRRGSTSHHHHHDALGSTRFLTDSTGNVTDTYLNDAWGNSVASTGTTVNPFTWVGKYGYYTDNSTGQVYVRARMYQPTVARWASADPLAVRPRNMVLYDYTRNSPTQLIDADGLDVTVDRNLALSGDYKCGDLITAGWKFVIQGAAPATGYIIQRVSIHCQFSRCLWCDARAPSRPTFEFYEAWEAINAGGLGSVSDYGQGEYSENTCGTFNAIGEVRFFFTRDYTDPKTKRTYKGVGMLGESPNYGWKRGIVHGLGLGCPTDAGNLRSSKEPPRTTATPPELPGKPDWDNGLLLGRRTFNMDWKCCCGIKDRYATLNVGSSH